MPAPAIVETHADREALASLWTAILAPWPRAADLAHVLGVDRSLLSHYASGSRSPGWPATRAAARHTARRYPEAAPALMQALAREMLDIEGHWVPEVDAQGLGSVDSEAADVMVATSALLTAARSGASEAELQRLAGEAIREMHEYAAASRVQ